MKKVIRLTESDLTRIVKRTIMELDRSTYDKAGIKAKDLGLNKLSSRFREHGMEKGENQDRENITIIEKSGLGEKNLRMMSAHASSSYGSRHYQIKLDYDNTEFILSVFGSGDKLDFYDGMQRVYPKTRKDTKKIINFLEKEVNFDSSNMDLKKMTYDDI